MIKKKNSPSGSLHKHAHLYMNLTIVGIILAVILAVYWFISVAKAHNGTNSTTVPTGNQPIYYEK